MHAAVTVAEPDQAPRDSGSWSAQYRFDVEDRWRQCDVVDISLDAAEVELHEAARDQLRPGPFYLQIDSVADDQVGIIVGAVLRRHEVLSDGRVLASVQFSDRREERMLLHLLVRLHAYS